MEYAVLIIVILVAACTAGVIWDAYDVSDEELGMDETEEEQ